MWQAFVIGYQRLHLWWAHGPTSSVQYKCFLVFFYLSTCWCPQTLLRAVRAWKFLRLFFIANLSLSFTIHEKDVFDYYFDYILFYFLNIFFGLIFMLLLKVLFSVFLNVKPILGVWCIGAFNSVQELFPPFHLCVRENIVFVCFRTNCLLFQWIKFIIDQNV